VQHNSTAVVANTQIAPFLSGVACSVANPCKAGAGSCNASGFCSVGPWNGAQINIGVTSPTNLGTVMAVSTVLDGTHLTLTTPWAGSDGTYIALKPSNACLGVCKTPGMGSFTMQNTGGQAINNFIHDMPDGVITGNEYGDGKLIYGNKFYFNGEGGAARAYGHNLYLGNSFSGWVNGCDVDSRCSCYDCIGGEQQRMFVKANIDLRSFQIPTQIYHASGEV